MALGTFTPPATGGKSSTFDPRPQFGNVGKPLIVVPREFKPDFVTPKYPNPKNVVIVDVVDLSPLYSGGEAVVLPSVIWGAAAVVDYLKPYCLDPNTVNTPLPVKIETRVGASGTPYAVLNGLADAELNLAAMWDQKFGLAFIDHAAAAKRAADQAAAAQQPQAPQWQQQPQAPVQQWQPQAPQQAPVQQWQPQNTAAPAQWQQPAQSEAPVAAPPATEDALQAAIDALSKS